MSRFTDDLVSRPVGVEGPPPQLVSSLLRELDVHRAPRDEQEAAITAWLLSHEPSQFLAEDLRREGFGHLLHPRLTA